MTGIKAVLCVLVVATSMLSGNLIAADDLQGKAVGRSAVVAGEKPADVVNRTIGRHKDEPTASTANLEFLLWVCRRLRAPGETLSDCIGTWDPSTP